MASQSFIYSDDDYGLVLINDDYDPVKHTSFVWLLSVGTSLLAATILGPIFTNGLFATPVFFFGTFACVWFIRSMENNPQSYMGKVLTSGDTLPRHRLHMEFLYKYIIIADDRQMNFPEGTQGHRMVTALVNYASAVNTLLESAIHAQSRDEYEEIFRDYSLLLTNITDEYGAAAPVHIADKFIEFVNGDLAIAETQLRNYSTEELLQRRKEVREQKADRAAKRFSKAEATNFEYEQMFDVIDMKRQSRPE